MVNRDVILLKYQHIKRSLDRLKGKKSVKEAAFLQNQDLQDIVLFNLQIAIQGCVDLASHVVSDNDWGAPSTMAELFLVFFPSTKSLARRHIS